MCDYKHEISFNFDDSSVYEKECPIFDTGFESMWQQIGDELRREQEINQLGQLFQQKMNLDYHPQVYFSPHERR